MNLLESFKLASFQRVREFERGKIWRSKRGRVTFASCFMAIVGRSVAVVVRSMVVAVRYVAIATPFMAVMTCFVDIASTSATVDNRREQFYSLRPCS